MTAERSLATGASLSRQTVKVVAVTLAVQVALLFAACWTLIQTSAWQVEQGEAFADVARVKKALLERLDELERLVKDWGEWDASYAFVADLNSAFVDENLYPQSLANIDVDGIAFLDVDDALRWGTFLGPDGTSRTEQLQPLLRPPKLLPGNVATSWIGTSPAGDRVMLASFPLLPSGGGGPSRGRVVFARRVREADAKLLEGLLGLAVALDLNPADASPNAPDRWIASASPDRLVAAGRIRDAGGRPWVGVRVTGPRPIHRQALATTWVVLGVVAVAGVLLGALQVVAVRKLLLARLIRLREEVAAIELEGDRLAPVTVDGDDELAAVAGGINAVFESARRARRALRESAQRRQEAERLELMGQLAGGVAHDLNNQLQVIRGSAELIEQDGTDPAFVQERAEAIVTTARESAEHVRRLLAFARKGNYRREEVPVDRLAGDLARLLTGTFEARIKVETDLGAAGAVVRGDPVQLQEALAGVAFNARDAMADDGVLRIATDREPPPVGPDRADAGWVHVAIADTGCGIAPEDLERVFEPYFTRKEGGTGLGLSACHGIVSNHGGVVTLESVVGEGTTVHIFLPVERGAAP